MRYISDEEQEISQRIIHPEAFNDDPFIDQEDFDAYYAKGESLISLLTQDIYPMLKPEGGSVS